MNRQARRAAYTDRRHLRARTLARMHRALTTFLEEHPGVRPRFRGPERGVHIIAPLDEVMGKVALDADAQALCERFCAIGVEIGGPNAEPTLMMLVEVLAAAGVPYEPTPSAQLGKFRILGQGGEA